MTLHIRNATAADAGLPAELGGRTFYDTFRHENTEEDMQAYIAKAYSPAYITANLQRSDIFYAIAYDNDKPVGYTKLIADATYEGLTGACIELEKIYVLKDHQGTQAGKALMQHAIDTAREKGFGTLFLGVWGDNERALAFYRRFGFETFTTRKFQLGARVCDDLMMKLEL